MNTITVGQLRQALAKYPSDMLIMATWDGICVEITEENISVIQDENGKDELCIDVNT